MIQNSLLASHDIRQSPQWADYMQSINWDIEKTGLTTVFIRKIPFLNCSMIKIQHQKGKVDFTKIDQIAYKYKSLACVIEPFDDQNESQFSPNGYQKSRLLFAHSATFKIDLTVSKNKLFNSFSENARRNIKKSVDNKLEIKIIQTKKSNNSNYIKDFYNLMHSLEKIKKVYTLSKSEYYKKVSAFKDTSVFLFAYEKNSSQPIAAIWLSYYKKTINYMQTGITPTGYQTNANYLLVWEGLNWAKRNRFKIWDFDAIYDQRYPKLHKSWKKFTEFKSRFHGKKIEYPPPQIKFYSLIFKLFYLCETILTR